MPVLSWFLSTPKHPLGTVPSSSCLQIARNQPCRRSCSPRLPLPPALPRRPILAQGTMLRTRVLNGLGVGGGICLEKGRLKYGSISGGLAHAQDYRASCDNGIRKKVPDTSLGRTSAAKRTAASGAGAAAWTDCGIDRRNCCRCCRSAKNPAVRLGFCARRVASGEGRKGSVCPAIATSWDLRAGVWWHYFLSFNIRLRTK